MPKIPGEMIQLNILKIGWNHQDSNIPDLDDPAQLKDLDPEDRQLFAVEKAGRGPMRVT